MYVPGLAVNDTLPVEPAATSVAPALIVTPGISNVSVCPAGSALVMLTVTVSPSFTTSCGPGRLAVAVAQLPRPNPQIGTLTAPVSVAVPGLAHKVIVTGAADADEFATANAAAVTATMSRARLFRIDRAASARIVISFASLLMARRR